ncbi:MAG TPA: hypothetical protein VIR63_01255, partial [Pontiella sp.]
MLKDILPGTAQVWDTPISAQAMLCLDLYKNNQINILWIATDIREMERLHESLRTLSKYKNRFPSQPPLDIFRFQPMEKDPAIFGEHLKLTQHLREENPFIIITCPHAVEQEIPIAGESDQAIITLSITKTYKLDELTNWMSTAGYEFGVEVYSQGEAALRGGILDFWPAGSPRPVRVEFFGDEIDSIRYFDDQSQCSIEKIDSIQIPQMDFGFAGEKTCLITDLLPENTLIINP